MCTIIRVESRSIRKYGRDFNCQENKTKNIYIMYVEKEDYTIYSSGIRKIYRSSYILEIKEGIR